MIARIQLHRHPLSFKTAVRQHAVKFLVLARNRVSRPAVFNEFVHIHMMTTFQTYSSFMVRWYD
ncbi:hypothetical protein ACPJHQ_04610 [Rossellomorea sp. H39__3]